MSASTETRATQGARPKNNPKSKAKPVRIDPALKYDYDRTEGPNPRDPRMEGPPCLGNHDPMKMGRGSLSGRNGMAERVVCGKCRLRLSYTPAFGAHAKHRQAGPLPADVKTVQDKGVTSVEELNSAEVALAGAEASLEKRLGQIRAARAKTRPSLGYPAPKTAPRSPSSDDPYDLVEEAVAGDVETLATTPPRKDRRGPSEAPEQLEFQSRTRET
jgi:hypothetical protein